MRTRVRIGALTVGLCVAAGVAVCHADAIYFKNGTSLTNVTVVSEDWQGAAVKVSDGVTMDFMREEILKIERERRKEPRGTREYPGERVDTVLREKLSKSVQINFPEPKSFTEIIDEISEFYGLEIKTDEKVLEAIKVGQIDPLWTFTKEDGKTLLDLVLKLCKDKRLEYKPHAGESIIISLPRDRSRPPAPPPGAVAPPPGQPPGPAASVPPARPGATPGALPFPPPAP